MLYPQCKSDYPIILARANRTGIYRIRGERDIEKHTMVCQAFMRVQEVEDRVKR